MDLIQLKNWIRSMINVLHWVGLLTKECMKYLGYTTYNIISPSSQRCLRSLRECSVIIGKGKKAYIFLRRSRNWLHSSLKPEAHVSSPRRCALYLPLSVNAPFCRKKSKQESEVTRNRTEGRKLTKCAILAPNLRGSENPHKW